ncbi:sodium/hydrogen exchanger 8 isoform X3 [Salvia miltiorrhiza]|uniref:sodium/hydrogen exchanger 8 isoform X3 n=1 Tax=Salvia miltiorrhiza TaxID=226208 RepID=UPI0025AD55D4|nr:sodium/hydrogen exchanger 8 isoform X3 [Salvia miltiorrhiza]
MASILASGTLSSPLRLLEEDSASDGNPTDAVLFVGISLVLGIACRHALRGTRVPYTVALLVLGIGLGALEHGTHHGLGKIGNGIRLWANIDPDLLLAVFLPALLFESSFSMEVHQIKRCMMQMFLLAVPGVLISTFCLGAALKLAFPYNWSWKTSLLLGGLLSATDPVAVVALLKELGASKKLSTIIEGESLMNDGTAIVVYQLFYRMVLGWNFNWGGLVKFLSRVSLGAVAMGLAFGIASVLWLGFIFNDTVIEISLTLAVSYLAFFTAQEGFEISGVLAVMTLGMFYSAVARTAFKGESQQSLHHFWEMVSYIANTLIFILSGVVIAESVLSSDNIFKTHEHSWGYLVLLYVFVQVARVVVVGVLFPFLQYFGYGLDWREATVLVWSGLRGAVALSLSLSVKFVFLTGGIVFLTLIVNGSTTQFVLHFLKMDKLSPAKRRILNYTKYEMLKKALDAFGDLGDDEELGPADWHTVKRYITSLNDVDGEQIHPHSLSENDANPDHMNLKDIRVRFLNGVQAAYWVMLDEGRINQTTANLLMRSVDEALDLVSHEALCDWKGLKSYVNIPNHYKFFQSSIVSQKLVTYFTVERLESACYICAAFLRAHRIAREQLHEFIGDSEIAAMVISESEQEGEEARDFLEEVRVTFPQVLRVVKTRQVTYSVLSHLIEYVNNLEKIGLLEEKEMSHLHDAVQTDLKKLLRNPPLVKIPKIKDLISANPLLGALPAMARETLAGSTKEIMRLSGTTLYKEGSQPTGIWLLSNGVVKWSTKDTSTKHFLHPTFTHGSTLGLYEVLAEKPYICDMVTNSVVMCFFVETEKILSVLRSDPAVEDFFWRESIIVIVKIMLPRVFEKMSMQDLRTLIAERSIMNIYIRGESFELLPQSVGFLLEGFIRTQGGQDEMLKAPAAILPHVDQSFSQSETLGARAGSFYHQVSVYQVETRSRVIIFDIAGFEAGRSLQKRSSSLISHSAECHSGSLGRERSGLMNWPQPLFNSYRHDGEVPGEQHNNLSARAMQLSIYGSMINLRRRRTRSFPRSSRVKPAHSLSYPRVPSVPTQRPMVTAKSEGSTTLRKKFDIQEYKRAGNAPERKELHRDESHARREESSDDSGGEEEHIVRIDSPSRLSFRQAP